MPAPARHQHKIIRPPHRQKTQGKGLITWLGFAGAFAAMIVMAMLFKDSGIDTWLVLLYGLVAIVLKIASEDSFKLALLALIGVPVLTLLQAAGLANNMAQYAFLLLCIGTVSALIEQWRQKK